MIPPNLEPHELIIAAFERAQLAQARAYNAPSAINYESILDAVGRPNLDPGARAASEVARLDVVNQFFAAVSYVREELGVEPELAWVQVRYLGHTPRVVAKDMGWEVYALVESVLRWEYEMCAAMRRNFEDTHR